MKIEWRPNWYELDQTVIVGDADFFYLTKDGNSFASNEISLENLEVFGEVLEIVHADLGEVRGILAEDLSYHIFIDEENFIQIDAEEKIGTAEYPDDCKIIDWKFQVELNIHRATGFSSLERMEHSATHGISLGAEQRKAKYRRLLGSHAFRII